MMIYNAYCNLGHPLLKGLQLACSMPECVSQTRFQIFKAGASLGRQCPSRTPLADGHLEISFVGPIHRNFCFSNWWLMERMNEPIARRFKVFDLLAEIAEVA